MSTKAQSFPPHFLWGTATAAHQVEGNNTNNDWWAWEHAENSPCAEPSGDCCDQFTLYPSDMKLIADLGLQAYRFSVEWARIEPAEGEFSIAALRHYKRVVEACLENSIAPIVTLHHFTTPQWVAAKGGWENPVTADLFARYSDKVARFLGDDVARWCTINEPNMVSTIGYLVGQFPPGKRDRLARDRVNEVFCDAHRKSRDAVKSVSSRPVGLTLAMAEFQVVGEGDDLIRAEAHRKRGFDGLETPFWKRYEATIFSACKPTHASATARRVAWRQTPMRNSPSWVTSTTRKHLKPPFAERMLKPAVFPSW